VLVGAGLDPFGPRLGWLAGLAGWAGLGYNSTILIYIFKDIYRKYTKFNGNSQI